MAIAGLGYGELLIVVGVIVLLFGATKIPTLMRSMGQGIGEFKKGLKEGQDEEQQRLQKSADEAKQRAQQEEQKASENPSA